MTQDPHLLPRYLHPPTACTSATYTKTPVVLSAQALRSSMFLHHYIVYKNTGTALSAHVHHCSVTKTILSKAWMKWTSQAAAMTEQAFCFPVTKKNGSCSLTSLWCSNVCSTSSLDTVLKWKGSCSPDKKETSLHLLGCYRKWSLIWWNAAAVLAGTLRFLISASY